MGNEMIYITPYILAFELLHGEIPYNNKELNKFIADDNCMNGLFKATMCLTSKYVKVPEEDMTLISVSAERDNMFSYYKKCEDIFVNYQRSVKNVTVTNASGNASRNSLKYQLNIPSEWAKQIGLTKEDKSVSMMSSKNNPPEKLLTGLGINNVGKATAKEIMRHFDSITALAKATVEELTAIQDEGGTNKLEEKTFCITGTLSSMGRKEAEELIEKNGGRIAGVS